MKKIVGIIAAVAMAASVFALDASAQLKMDGSLFDVQFADGAKVSALKLNQPSGRKPWGATGIDLNVNADKAGATINIAANKDGMVGYSLWIQPIDMLKVKFGDLDYCINKEDIDWSGCINGTGSNGFGFDLTPADGLSFNLVLNPGFDNSWINAQKLGSTAFYAKYSADFGTIGAAWIYAANPERDYTGWGIGKVNVPKFNTFSVGYGNTFGDVKVFADVALGLSADGDVKDSFDTALFDLAFDAYVKYAKDAFSVTAYLCYKSDLAIGHSVKKYDLDVAFGAYNDLSAKAKLTYAFDGFTPYLYVNVADILIDSDTTRMNIEIKPGVTFNIGSASCEIAVDIKNIGQDTKKGDKNPCSLSVPFGVTLGF